MNKRKINLLPELNYLNECFKYDSNTELLTWLERPPSHFISHKGMDTCNRNFSGKIAGHISKQSGRLIVGIDKKVYQAARICWKLHHLKEPFDTIDHINNNVLDNRILNLREASHAENQLNKIKRKDSKHKFKGVGIIKGWDKFYAKISYKGKSFYLGSFNTEYEAHLSYENAASKLHGEFYNSGVARSIEDCNRILNFVA
jgi:hypothetical protein